MFDDFIEILIMRFKLNMKLIFIYEVITIYVECEYIILQETCIMKHISIIVYFK